MRLLLLGYGVEAALERAGRTPVVSGVEAGPQVGDRRIDEKLLIGVEPVGPAVPDGLFRRAAEAILAYRVFPEWIVRPVLARVPLQVGDTFGNRAWVVPGLDVFFAGRVTETFDGPDRAGFSLRTVAGHPAVGEETIEVRKDVETGEVFVRISSWSRPGNWLVWLGWPIFGLVQRFAVRRALDRLARLARGGPGAG